MDLIDKRIMEILTHNCRTSTATIAKAMKLSKDAVKYRIRKLQEEEHYLGNILLIDTRRLGYTRYQLLIQFDAEIKDKKEIYQKLAKHPYNLWTNTFIGAYDIQIVIDAKNAFELQKMKEEIFALCNHKIRKHTTLTTIKEIEFTQVNPDLDIGTKIELKNNYSFSKLITKKRITNEPTFTHYTPTRKEIETLGALAKDPQASLIDIGEQVNIDRKTVKKHITTLIEKRIITHFSGIPNTQKMGYITYALFTKLAENTPKEVLYQPSEKLNNVFFAAKMDGEYDFIFYLNAKNPQELLQTIDTFKQTIGNYIQHTDLFIMD